MAHSCHLASAYGTSRSKFVGVKWGVPKPQKHDFSLKLTRVIEPKEGPGVELATLEDGARFMGHMRPWRQARPHWEYAAALVLKAQQSIPSALGRVPLAARRPHRRRHFSTTQATPTVRQR
jgi:hypothetical protein